MKTTLASLKQEIIACRQCPRLVEYREEVSAKKRAAYRDCHYWGKPLPGFGDEHGRLLIVGLAPAAHGGNRTGRLFTGDGSADFLMRALHESGFANQRTSAAADDGLQLLDAFMVAVVRCVPPDNKPSPEELRTCRQWLLAELGQLPNLKAVLCLGRIAMAGYLAAIKDQGHKLPKLDFGHGAEYDLLPGMPRLFASYHPSRQNTQTGRLTPPMLRAVTDSIRTYLYT